MKKNLLLVMLAYMLNPGIYAQGDLLVSPVRVIFEGNKVKEEISLVNIGNDTSSYSVSFLQYRMEEDGSFIVIEGNADGMFADKYLRVFPRKVTLAPRESQVVRLQLRRQPGMTDGEYRSHLYFRADKDAAPLGFENSDSSKLMSVRITPVFGISIPVIIRNGTVDVKSEIADVSLVDHEDGLSRIHLYLIRKGNISVYGDIVVDYLPQKGKSVEVGRLRGVAVYTSIEKREFLIKLDNQFREGSASGSLRIRFTSPKDTQPEVYAEKIISL